jgi:hypothetical protein
MMNGHQNVIRKHRSFLSTLAWGLSSIIITALVGAVLLGGYAMNIADRKTNNLFEFVESAIQGLPELTEALPPVLADAIHDERRPEYASELSITARLAESSRRQGAFRPVVELQNNGDELVSMLSMRVVVLNQNDEPVAEFHEWAATPITADHDWPGPLLPGSTRHLSAGLLILGEGASLGDYRAEVEVTDVRVWNRQAAAKPVSLTGGDA